MMNAMRTAKIAVVIPKYGLVGGGEKFAAELTERIVQWTSHEIHVLANQWTTQSGIIRFHKIPIINFPKYLTTVSFAWFVEQKIKEIGFDLVHSHERIFNADIVSLHSVPHEFWIRDIRKKRFFSLFDRATIRVEKCMVRNHKTVFLPVSSIAKEKFINEYPFLSGRVETLHPGVDVTVFNKSNRNDCRKKIRQQFNLNKSDMVLLFVGMNFELKGLDQLIKAIARLKIIQPSTRIKLLVVGKGNINKYQGMAWNAGLDGDIRFAGVIKEKMEEIYMSADIFVMLSQFDTFGMTVLEAMAASLPVIVSHNVGAKDLVQNGVNGFIVDRDDIDAISSRIFVLLDKEERMNMGLQAHHVAQNHTWDVMANNIIGMYEKILSSK